MSATNPSSSMNIERLEDETFPDPREKPGGPILLNCFQCVISARQKHQLEPNAAASVGSSRPSQIGLNFIIWAHTDSLAIGFGHPMQWRLYTWCAYSMILAPWDWGCGHCSVWWVVFTHGHGRCGCWTRGKCKAMWKIPDQSLCECLYGEPKAV